MTKKPENPRSLGLKRWRVSKGTAWFETWAHTEEAAWGKYVQRFGGWGRPDPKRKDFEIKEVTES